MEEGEQEDRVLSEGQLLPTLAPPWGAAAADWALPGVRETGSSGAWLAPSALCDGPGRRAGLKISDPLDVSPC